MADRARVPNLQDQAPVPDQPSQLPEAPDVMGWDHAKARCIMGRDHNHASRAVQTMQLRSPVGTCQPVKPPLHPGVLAKRLRAEVDKAHCRVHDSRQLS